MGKITLILIFLEVFNLILFFLKFFLTNVSVSKRVVQEVNIRVNHRGSSPVTFTF